MFCSTPVRGSSDASFVTRLSGICTVFLVPCPLGLSLSSCLPCPCSIVSLLCLSSGTEQCLEHDTVGMIRTGFSWETAWMCEGP